MICAHLLVGLLVGLVREILVAPGSPILFLLLALGAPLLRDSPA